MSKLQNCKGVIREKNEKKQNNEMADFFQLLQNNGMFVDCVSPVKEGIEEIEKQLK